MHHPLGALVLAACTSSVGAGPGVPNEVPSGPGVVITDRGAVRGTRSGDVVAWLGVPYAAPPLGELHWRPPQQMPAWNGVLETSSWSQSCVEITTSGLLVGGGEDCLYLNVWAPTEVTDRLPVLVFLHGGFALNGAASHVVNGNRIYDGAYVAAHGPAIVVTLNYRLGALGYFTSPELAAGSSTGASGNYALHDQLAALQWVHDNIRGFGGDPDHVLVFGESAGGASTCALLASPRGTGLFSAALIESGDCGASTAEAAQRLSTALVHGAGCDQYWVRFAATGDPNGAGAAAWPLYDAADDPAIVFGAGIRTTNGIRSQQCDLWDRA